MTDDEGFTNQQENSNEGAGLVAGKRRRQEDGG